MQGLSDTGVPVGTTELIQMQEYPEVLQNLFRYGTYQMQESP